MSEYKYKAVNAQGKIFEGRMHAANGLELEHRIENQSQDLITYSEIKASSFRFGRKKLQRKDLINMVFQLEQLTKSGVPLLDGLKDLRDTASEGYYRDVLASLVESIEGGHTFSESLKQFDQDFDTVFVSLISVGEESGELPRILKDMGSTLRWIDELVSATVKIMIYPAIVGVVVLAVTGFLMVYLVPKIIPLVAEMGGELPLHTKALIATSEFVVAYWWILLAAPIATKITVGFMCRRNRDFLYKVDKFKLAIPLFGKIAFMIKVARLSNYMALLYSSGITILRSLEICKNLMSNVVLEEAIERVYDEITHGASMSEGFNQAGLFPPLVIRMVRVGENTGNLDEALLNVSYFFNREVQEAIDKIEPTITPVLTVVMGTLLGWIMISVLGPIWDVVGNIQ